MKTGPAEARPRAQKKEWLVLLLAMLPGFLGLLGLGHFYLGKWVRGAVLLLGGLALLAVGWALFLLGLSALPFGARTAAALMLGGIALMGLRLWLWVWHTQDARRISHMQRD